LQKDKVTVLARFFTSICMATSFLSISLCLSDFLSDGLRISKQGISRVLIYAMTFLPPVMVVLLYPDAFIRGLSYAGICCFILMILFPPLMVWRGRYHLALTKAQADYQVGGGKFLLALLLIFATLMIGFGFEGTV
jgi:Amino acid permeases